MLQREEFHNGLMQWRNLSHKDVPEEKSKLVATKLCGYTTIWWDKVQEMRL